MHSPRLQIITHPQHLSYHPNSGCWLNFRLYSITSTYTKDETSPQNQKFITSPKSAKYYLILIPLGNILFYLLIKYFIQDLFIGPFSRPGPPSPLIHLQESTKEKKKENKKDNKNENKNESEYENENQKEKENENENENEKREEKRERE